MLAIFLKHVRTSISEGSRGGDRMVNCDFLGAQIIRIIERFEHNLDALEFANGLSR